MKLLLLKTTSVLLFFFISTPAYTQCNLSSTGIGSFDQTSDFNAWFKGDQGQGAFTQESTQVRSGMSLRADVFTFSPWQVRIFNNACTINFSEGRNYEIGLWLKGETGNQFSVTLDDANVSPSHQFTVIDTNWNFYSVNLIASASTANGRLRVNFKSVGAYFLDDLTLQDTDCQGVVGGTASLDTCGICAGGTTGITPNELCTTFLVTPDNPNIRYNGTINKDVTASSARLFRFTESYINSFFPFFRPIARTQSGISISIKTNSPRIVLHFDTLGNAEIRARNFAVFEEGTLLEDGIQGLDVSISNSDNIVKEYEVYLPSFSGVRLLNIELVQGYVLQSIPEENKPVYVAIGNSITHGVGQTLNGSHLTYPFLVADSLNYRMFNLGIGGSTINSNVISNLDSLSGGAPELITVLWGYNNVVFNSADLSGAINDYRILIENLATNYPSTSIYGILQTETLSTVGTNPANTIERLRQEQDSVLRLVMTTHNNVCIIDGNQYTSTSDLFDDVHLNDQGARNLANGIITELDACSTITGVNNVVKNNVRVYPNPTTDILHLEMGTKEIQHIKLIDVNGNVVQTSKNKSVVNVSALPEGTYLIKILTKGDERFSFTFLKE